MWIFNGRKGTGCALAAAIALVLLAACDGGGGAVVEVGEEPPPDASACSIPSEELLVGAVRDGIAALSDPVLVDAEAVDYIFPDDRVLGVAVGDEAFAISYDALWIHEVVNLTLGGRRLVVTYCPLTGSGLVFDRSVVGGAEFGVSGLLFRNNLVLHDRREPSSLWPQMSLGARCGPANGVALPVVHSIETTWTGWRALYPKTRTIRQDQIDPRFVVNPFRSYRRLDNRQLLFALFDPPDERRPLKERVLGLPHPDGTIAFPFLELDNGFEVRVVHFEAGGERYVVFWRRAWETAAVYRLRPSDPEEFNVFEGQFFDTRTQSRWSIDGRGLDGQFIGTRLEPAPGAYVAFWFAWAAFHPETTIWQEIR